MIRPELLKMLVCPETRGQLNEAPAALIAQLNQAISGGRLKNKAGQQVEHKLDAGLLREDGAVVYPVVDGIPMMLVDEGIPLNQPALNS